MTDSTSRGPLLLCVPRRCGLNDILVQVWLSYEEARAHGRHLVIDTRLSGLWDDFGYYFHPRTAAARELISTSVSEADLADWNHGSVSPSHLSGRLDFVYRESRLRMNGQHHPSRARRLAGFTAGALRRPEESDWPLRRRLQFLAATGRRRAADANLAGEAASEAQLVVHHRSGGGPQSVLALRLFRLSHALRSAVRSALAKAGGDYDAIHIRHTDLASDYLPLLREARDLLAGRRVLVCSDDAAAITQARRTLVDSEVFTVTATANTHGAPLHKIGASLPLLERRRLATNQIIDLLALAHGRRLMVARTKDGALSGYSRLAQLLQQDPGLRDTLLGGDHSPTTDHTRRVAS